ncbi:hypothetical protein [Sphingopyxis bauzanensis]|uniref:hypothetical protein n=1 Tax=Sphingopyxis bauzanensis TaxID=651663 RepID=UPI001666025D|nr:hypothetical protein [Sphingopyxis bauzanensis]GGJ65412.1 hypothetical protein GCM10011393_39670 [Sphingopyxis bauzanensis]
MTDRQGEMAMDEQAYLDLEAALERGLTKAPIITIGLGGAISTGLFIGSGCRTVRTRGTSFILPIGNRMDGSVCGAVCGL